MSGETGAAALARPGGAVPGLAGTGGVLTGVAGSDAALRQVLHGLPASAPAMSKPTTPVSR